MRARRYHFDDDPGPKPLSNDPIGRQHRIPRDPDEEFVCIHPRRAVKFNPFNNVYQCHVCGHILYDEDGENEQIY